MIWVLISFIIVLVLILCLFIRVRVHLRYTHQGQDNEGRLTLSILGGIIKKKWEIPTIKMDDDSFSIDYEAYTSGTFSQKKHKKLGEKKATPEDLEHQKETMQTILHNVVGFTSIMARFFKKVRVRQFRWETVLGTGDAAITGTLSGFAWGGKSAVFTVISKMMRVNHLPHLQVTPVFQASVFQTSLSCIVTFSVGNAMRALIQVLKHARKTGKQTTKHKPQDRNVSKEV